MSNKILLIIILVIVLIGGYFLFFNKQSANQVELPFDLGNNIQVEIRDMSDVPAEYFSGESRFSSGNCQTDADCHNIGCSLQMCSSDSDLVITCEIGGEFPDRNIYACGCILNTCGWYKK